MIKLSNITNLKENFYFQFIVLIGTVFLFVGKPVPYSNEYSYLLRLRQVYDSGYLANDITFSTPTNEYWLFDHIFGLLTLFFSIETVGWIGRVGCWSILLLVLIKLGKRWEIPIWMVSASIFLWLCVGQSIVADEWVFGGFEAKCVAYIWLILAMDRFCDEKDTLSAVLLGLAFAFHPIIGLWGIAAALPAHFIWHRDILRTIRVAAITGAISLIAVIPLLQMLAESVLPTAENLRFFELVRLPLHFDPFSWSRSAILLIFIALIFVIFVHIQVKNAKPPKFLVTFLTILGFFFMSGIFLRALNSYELMKYTPTRLFAVFIPLFFFFYLFKAYYENMLYKPLMILILLQILFLAIWNKLPAKSFDQAASTFTIWNEQSDDTAEAFIWLKNHTPNDTIVLAPPWRYDFWYLSGRAEVVNFRKPIISNVGEWQSRLEIITGKADLAEGFREDKDLEKFYFELSEETVDCLTATYRAQYFISETDYQYPIVYTRGKVKVYHLR